MYKVIPLSCGGDGIHYLYDAMQGRVSANGHVSSTEIIVNGAHHANNIEVGGTFSLICSDFPCKYIQMTALLSIRLCQNAQMSA